MKHGKIVGLGIFLEDIDSLVIADLHIGYEETLAEQGIHLPQSQYFKIKEAVEEMVEKTNPSRIIIDGDVKHEFGAATRQEWSEVLDLIEFLQENVKEIIVVRGNHDNFLIPILKRKGIELYDPFYAIENYYFTHGHKDLTIDAANYEYIILGHEHPAVSIRDELGIKYKFKCILEGKVNDQVVVILPALSPLMPGSSVNELDSGQLLSPYLRRIDISDFEVYVVDPEVGIYDFGKLKYLRSQYIEI